MRDEYRPAVDIQTNPPCERAYVFNRTNKAPRRLMNPLISSDSNWPDFTDKS